MPDTKDRIWCDFIYVKCPEKTNLYKWKVDEGLRGHGLAADGHKAMFLGVMECSKTGL